MDWLNWALGSTTLLSAVAAFWTWYTKSYLPAKQAEQERERERQHKQNLDQQDFLQETQSNALEALLGITGKTIDHLIALSNGRFDELARSLSDVDEKLRQLNSRMAHIETQAEMTQRDWSRINEIQSDIDLVLHRIESALGTSEYREDRE